MSDPNDFADQQLAERVEEYTKAVEWGRRKGREEMRRAVISWIAENARRGARREVPIAQRRRIVNDMFKDLDGKDWG